MLLYSLTKRINTVLLLTVKTHLYILQWFSIVRKWEALYRNPHSKTGSGVCVLPYTSLKSRLCWRRTWYMARLAIATPDNSHLGMTRCFVACNCSMKAAWKRKTGEAVIDDRVIQKIVVALETPPQALYSAYSPVALVLIYCSQFSQL